MVEANNGAQRLVLRLRTDQPKDHNIAGYSTAVVIAWDYSHQSSLMPDEAAYQRMLNLERALDDLSMENGLSYLMNVGTGAGLREWCYYARDRDLFMQRFNALLAGHEPYPLKIEFYDDPEWKVWNDLLKLHKRAAPKPSPAPAAQPVESAGFFSRIRKWLRRGR